MASNFPFVLSVVDSAIAGLNRGEKGCWENALSPDSDLGFYEFCEKPASLAR